MRKLWHCCPNLPTLGIVLIISTFQLGSTAFTREEDAEVIRKFLQFAFLKKYFNPLLLNDSFLLNCNELGSIIGD